MQKSARKIGGQPRIDPADRDTIPLFSYGFRPFFLGAAIWALVALNFLMASLLGSLELAPGYGALAWHGHEMLFGYASGVVAGFLLTAVPTGPGDCRSRAGGSRCSSRSGAWAGSRFSPSASPARFLRS